MEDYIPYDLTDDDETEELPAREIFRPIPKEDLDFLDIELFVSESVFAKKEPKDNQR